MKHRPQAALLMPDMASGFPPADAINSSVRWPRIRRVVAANHPIDLKDGDPALDELLTLVGKAGMTEFGDFVSGGFRMVELIGLIDDPADQIPACLVDDLKPEVPVLPMASTQTKLIANALVIVALRGLGATIEGPYEQPVFLPSSASTSSRVLAWKLLALPGVLEVLSDDLWWAEVPPIAFYVHDPDNDWKSLIPCPEYVVEIFLQTH